MTDFDRQYQALLEKIINTGYQEKNQRTGHICYSLPGQTMQFDLEAEFPLLTLRKIPLKVFIAEQIWFLMGEQKIDWLQDFTKIWDDFADEVNTSKRRIITMGNKEWPVGENRKASIIEAAYGYRWRKHFQRDQIAGLIELLKSDPTSRHGVILMWDPADDGLASGTKKKNVPCPYTFTVQIIGGKLHLHLVIRSNDMMLGNPHDVAGFALLAHFLAQKLATKAGCLTISISNAHIYDIHIEQAKTIIARESNHSEIKLNLPDNSFDRAEKGDKELVQEIFSQIKEQYNPQESLGKMKIVL